MAAIRLKNMFLCLIDKKKHVAKFKSTIHERCDQLVHWESDETAFVDTTQFSEKSVLLLPISFECKVGNPLLPL